MSDLNAARQALLAQWEKERDELNMLISRLRRELGLSADAQPEPVIKPEPITSGNIDVNALVQPGDFFGSSQVQACADFLRRTNRQPCTLQTIAEALYRGKATETRLEEKALRNLSSLLSRSDDFISVARGRWGLAEWYPNRVKQRRKPQETSEETQ